MANTHAEKDVGRRTMGTEKTEVCGHRKMGRQNQRWSDVIRNEGDRNTEK